MEYRALQLKDMDLKLFSHFDRYQRVKRCWRKEENDWVLKDISFEEKWDEKDLKRLVIRLKDTLTAGGSVYGAFLDDILVGFSSIENELYGSNLDYLILSNLHVSYDHRGKGIGKSLFLMTSEKAKLIGAKKLYISAHSSEETQAFYKNMGCYEAVEYNDALVSEEPFDCQLEYTL